MMKTKAMEKERSSENSSLAFISCHTVMPEGKRSQHKGSGSWHEGSNGVARRVLCRHDYRLASGMNLY